ncbi:MAG: amidohydrolase family protein [Alphaproteobacteria bacterium]|nr:amidohydrolase family protein [Alphaproteobacteria bacterium]
MRSDRIDERRHHRREVLKAAGALPLAMALGPDVARAAGVRGLKDIVPTRTFDVESHIDSLEWWAGEGLPKERPYSRAQLAADARAMRWTDGETGFEENLDRLLPFQASIQIEDRAAALFAEYDAAGIDTACQLIVDHAFEESSYGRKYAVDYERIFADCTALRAAWPGRVLTFAGVDPRRGGKEGAALLRRAIEDHGCSGLGEQVLQQYKVFPADRERCYPLYEVCVEHAVPYFGNCEGPAPETMPLAYEQVAKDFPTLKICLAGAGRPRTKGETTEEGWAPTEDALRLANAYENIYLDMADWWRRDPGNIGRYLTFLRRCFDSDARTKVMFATDHPVFVAMGPVRSWVDVLVNAAEHGVTITDEEIALYYSGNPTRFLEGVL